jgi:hypothetical protein
MGVRGLEVVVLVVAIAPVEFQDLAVLELLEWSERDFELLLLDLAKVDRSD